MASESGIDWERIWLEQRGRRRSVTYSSRLCPYCGRTISESAYSGQAGNWKKHAAACERGRQEASP